MSDGFARGLMKCQEKDNKQVVSEISKPLLQFVLVRLYSERVMILNKIWAGLLSSFYCVFGINEHMISKTSGLLHFNEDLSLPSPYRISNSVWGPH